MLARFIIAAEHSIAEASLAVPAPGLLEKMKTNAPSNGSSIS